jgi:uncharacterized protein YndB with AHSA1/START domain
MKLEIKASIQIAKTTAEVYEAIVAPEKMTQYFIASASGRMESNTPVEWTFPEFDVKVPVKVGELQEGSYISFYWDDEDGTPLMVEMQLIPKGPATQVIVTEKSRESDEAGIKWYGRNTEGWANFLACLKAYLEFGINLRKGAFDFMKQA